MKKYPVSIHIILMRKTLKKSHVSWWRWKMKSIMMGFYSRERAAVHNTKIGIDTSD